MIKSSEGHSADNDCKAASRARAPDSAPCLAVTGSLSVDSCTVFDPYRGYSVSPQAARNPAQYATKLVGTDRHG